MTFNSHEFAESIYHNVIKKEDGQFFWERDWVENPRNPGHFIRKTGEWFVDFVRSIVQDYVHNLETDELVVSLAHYFQAKSTSKDGIDELKDILLTRSESMVSEIDETNWTPNPLSLFMPNLVEFYTRYTLFKLITHDRDIADNITRTLSEKANGVKDIGICGNESTSWYATWEQLRCECDAQYADEQYTLSGMKPG